MDEKAVDEVRVEKIGVKDVDQERKILKRKTGMGVERIFLLSPPCVRLLNVFFSCVFWLELIQEERKEMEERVRVVLGR